MSLINSEIWFGAERMAWCPPEDIRVSDWADRYRMLPIKLSPEPGPWRGAKAPYTIEIMDSFTDPIVERITIMASVQSSKTEPVYNMLGFAIDQDSAPVLIVMPTDKAIKKSNIRIQHMINDSPQLARHITGNPDDIKQKEINLNNLTMWFATAGSTTDLRHVAARYIYMDETDDYPEETGDQGNPHELAEARATTFWNRKIIESCTPTDPEGHINQQYEKSDKRKYWVPCPFCKGYQVLSFWQVKHKGEVLGEWPRDKRDPEYIKRERPARYECIHCQEEIDDIQKPWMLKYGTWVPEGHQIDQDGSVAIPRPRTSHRGYWWSALYSLWRSFSDIAAQFFATKDNRDKYKTFVQLWLAEVWKETFQKRETTEILTLRTELPGLLVPAGALALTAGIDTQKHGFWMVIRAWFRDLSSQRIYYDFVENWEGLEQWLFHQVYPAEGDENLQYVIWRGGIDIGGGEGDPGEVTMTEQVYNWLRINSQGRIFGVMGLSRALPGGNKLRLSVIDKMPGRGGKPIPGGIQLWTLDTGKIKDAIWSRIESGKFKLDAAADKRYAQQLTAEAKERDKRGNLVWTVQGGRANHALDCEVYAAAMADPECWGGVMVLPDVDAQPRRTGPMPRKPVGWVRSKGGQTTGHWIGR